MSKTTAAKTQPVDKFEQEWRRKVSFNFGKGGMEKPKNLSDLGVEDEITVLVTGKVTEVRSTEDTSSFELRMEKVEIQTETKGNSLAADFKAAKKKV
jgi:RPA family protein